MEKWNKNDYVSHTETLEGTSAKPRFGLLLIKVHKTAIDVLNDGSLENVLSVAAVS
jgi:hypothetical protein